LRSTTRLENVVDRYAPFTAAYQTNVPKAAAVTIA
jgi:hypothetical protein